MAKSAEIKDGFTEQDCANCLDVCRRTAKEHERILADLAEAGFDLADQRGMNAENAEMAKGLLKKYAPHRLAEAQ